MGKLLRIVAIILLGLTALQTLLGAVGSVCISWFPEKYASLVVVAPYKGVYQAATILTFVAAVLAFAAVFGLLRGKGWAYRAALAALLLGLATAALKMYFSNRLRGSTMPTDIRFYLTLVTLAYFLLLRIPGLWAKADLTRAGRDGSVDAATGLAMVLGGLVVLSTPLWAGASHTLDGYNLVLVLATPLRLVGGGLLAGGAALLVRTRTGNSPARAGNWTRIIGIR